MFFIKKNKAFSLTELLTSVGIIGTLSVVGIKSYQRQTNQAKTSEAKKSLSYVYTAERNFHNSWGAYHENLSAIGATPTGPYNYDVGFHKTANLKDSGGDLHGDYPLNPKIVLYVRECTSFKQICDGDCYNTVVASVGSTHSSYFSTADCTVNSPVLLKSYSGTDYSSQANQNSFKALAVGQLKSRDIWSIDQAGTTTHEEDGTQ